ncbi:hypothetical protein ACE6H2_015743 [Prunus campanulata]
MDDGSLEGQRIERDGERETYHGRHPRAEREAEEIEAAHPTPEIVRQVTGGARVVRRHPDDIDGTEVGVGVEVALCLLLLYPSLQAPSNLN